MKYLLIAIFALSGLLMVRSMPADTTSNSESSSNTTTSNSNSSNYTGSGNRTDEGIGFNNSTNATGTGDPYYFCMHITPPNASDTANSPMVIYVSDNSTDQPNSKPVNISIDHSSVNATNDGNKTVDISVGNRPNATDGNNPVTFCMRITPPIPPSGNSSVPVIPVPNNSTDPAGNNKDPGYTVGVSGDNSTSSTNSTTSR